MNARNMRERRKQRMQKMQQQIETKQKLQDNFKNTKQHEVMEKVYEYLLYEACSINDCNILEEPKNYKFTHYEFCKLIDNIIDNFENGSSEYEEYMTYKHLNIVIRKLKDNVYEMRTDVQFDIDVSFSYEELFDIKQIK